MKLEELGYNDELERFRVEHNLQNFEIGRVITEHKEHFESSVAERRKKDKEFGKMIKNYKKDRNNSGID